jgi:hypothetical protein
VSQLREQLLGYLLGALEADEIRDIEKRLAESPQVREELERLKVALFPLESLRDVFEPRGDLAERTCQRIDAQCAGDQQTADQQTADQQAQAAAQTGDPERMVSPAGRSLAPHARLEASPTIPRRSTGWLDTFVSVGVCTALALLFFPALLNSRELARRNLCQANLRHVGMAIELYHTRFGSIPYIPLQGPNSFVGYYASVLRDYAYLENDCQLICPGSDIAAHRNGFCVPSQEVLERARPDELIRLRALAGGSYGHHLGVFAETRHFAPALHDRSQCVIMTDAPDYHRPNFISSHHGGQGMNVLFADMRCLFIRGCEILGPNGKDNVFLNSDGHIAAGLGYHDSVIASSGISPRIITVSLPDRP